MILNTGISYYEQISWYMLMLCMCQSLPTLLYLGLTPMFFKVASYCFIANFPGLTMPPKRKSVGEAVLSKRRKTTASTPVDTDVISMSPPTSAPSVDQSIDYDKLATAILRQSKLSEVSTPQLQQGQHQIVDTQDHHLLGNQPPQQTCASGIGAILDQVFLGEPARSAQPVLNIKEGIPLGASVSSKIKTKIWNHEYVDFKSLIDSKEEPLSVTISTGVINLHQGQKTKYPISLNQWTDAFLIFSAVYLEKFANEAQNLLKYGHMIRELQYLHGDHAFRQYDEQFRKLKETINVPWQIPVQELRLKVATTKFSSTKLQQNQPFRSRICYQYNKGERCNRVPCPFKHVCLQYKSNHPKTKCPDIPKTSLSKATHPSPFSKTS